MLARAGRPTPGRSAIGRAVAATAAVTLLAAPVVSAASPVVGDLLMVAPASWSLAPTGRAWQWRAGGVAITGAVGPTYRVVDADAAPSTRGPIDVVETATFAGAGQLTATTAATAMPRRTRAAVAFGIGRLTRSGFGAVPLASPRLGLLGVGAAAATFALALTTGTAGHWTFTASGAVNTPAVNGTGATAGLPSPTYAWSVTATFADGLSESCTITVTPLPDVFTLGQADNFDALGTTHTALVSGKVVELAAGASYTGRKTFKALAPAATTTIRAHDPARTGWPAAWEFHGCANLQVDDLAADGTTQGTGLLSRFVLSTGQSAPRSGLPCENMVINRPTFRGSPAVYNSSAVPGLQVSNGRNVTIADADFEYVKSGIVGAANSASLVADNIAVIGAKVRHFFDNGWISGVGGVEKWLFRGCAFMAPDRVVAGAHCDGYQIHDNAVGVELTIEDQMLIHADGTATIQGMFAGSAANVAGDGSNGHRVTIRNLISTGSAVNVVTLADVKSASLRCVQTFYDRRNLVDPNVDVTYAAAARVSLNAGSKWSGAHVLDRIACFSSVSVAAGIANVASTNVVNHGGSGFNHPTAAPAVLPDYVTPGYHASDPHAAIAALDYAAMSTDQIIAAIKNIVQPKLDGAYKLADGRYVTPLLPDGSWNAA